MDTSDGKSMDLSNSDYNGLPQAVQQQLEMFDELEKLIKDEHSKHSKMLRKLRQKVNRYERTLRFQLFKRKQKRANSSMGVSNVGQIGCRSSAGRSSKPPSKIKLSDSSSSDENLDSNRPTTSQDSVAHNEPESVIVSDSDADLSSDNARIRPKMPISVTIDPNVIVVSDYESTEEAKKTQHQKYLDQELDDDGSDVLIL